MCEKINILLKKIISLLLISFLCALVFFKFVEISCLEFIIISIVILFILILNISMKKNSNIFCKIILIIIGSGVGLLFNNKNILNVIKNNFISVEFLPSANQFIICALVIITVIFYACKHGKNPVVMEDKELFYEHEKDLQQIMSYLGNKYIQIIGVEAAWGNGKTYLLQELQKRLYSQGKDEFEFVVIDIISTNLDNLLEYLVDELDNLLLRNDVYSRYSRQLKKIFSSNTNLSLLYSLLQDNDLSYSKTLDGFKKELLGLNKKILIIYEDLDRIQKNDLIIKIFYISEKLSAENIKVIYQYNENRMIELGFKSIYLDKYIPFRIKLTNIKLENIICYILKEMSIKENILDNNDLHRFPPLLLVEEPMLLDRNYIEKASNIFFEDRYTIRCAEHFIYELNENAKYYVGEGNKRKKIRHIVIAFFFVKHFMPEIFNELSTENDLLDSLKIEYNDDLFDIPVIIKQLKNKNCTDQDIINNLKTLKKLFDPKINSINFQKYIALMLLGLPSSIEEIINQSNVEENTRNINETVKMRMEKIYNQSAREMLQDEHINYQTVKSIVYYLLEAGKPKNINYIAFANSLLEVFKKSEELWFEEYEKLFMRLFKGEENFGTIFLLGIDRWTQIFKAFYIASEDWNVIEADLYYKKIIKFYFCKEFGIEDFDVYLIRSLNFCWDGISKMKSRGAFRFLLQKLNTLKIIGNMNNSEYFWEFLKRSILTVYNLGYDDRIDYWEVNTYFDYNNKRFSEMTSKFLDDMICRMDNYLTVFKNNNVDNNYLQEISDYKLIQTYLQNIKLIMGRTEVVKEEEYPYPTVHISDEYQKDLEKYIQMDEGTFEKELSKNKLSPFKIMEILKRRSEKKNKLHPKG